MDRDGPYLPVSDLVLAHAVEPSTANLALLAVRPLLSLLRGGAPPKRTHDAAGIDRALNAATGATVRALEMYPTSSPFDAALAVYRNRLPFENSLAYRLRDRYAIRLRASFRQAHDVPTWNRFRDDLWSRLRSLAATNGRMEFHEDREWSHVPVNGAAESALYVAYTYLVAATVLDRPVLDGLTPLVSDMDLLIPVAEFSHLPGSWLVILILPEMTLH